MELAYQNGLNASANLSQTGMKTQLTSHKLTVQQGRKHICQTGLTRKIFGVARSMKKNRSHKPRYRYLPSPKRDSDDSDWNEILYPYNYRAKVQSQVSPR